MFSLNWFDVVSVVSAIVGVIIIKCINAILQTSVTDDISTTSPSANVASKTDATATTTPTTPKTTPPTTPSGTLTKNGKLEKQISLDCENGTSSLFPTITISTTSVSTTTTTTTATNPSNPNSSPTYSIHNGFLTHTLSFDTLGDEYHEDEDTLSLENLFPCDQTEIYASKKISFIIDELIQTEANYVNNLRKGLKHYGDIQSAGDLPEALVGSERRQQLLTNIEEILELHEKQILPLMLRNQRDLKGLFDEFAAHFDKSNFYCYVTFTMGKKVSMQLRQENREWFQQYQTQVNDKLGIDSFLVQPIQRLARYPLLLQQFISEFYKSGISCKPVLSSVCKLETRMRRQLDVVNQAEEISSIDDLTELDLQEQGHFRRATEFDAQHFPTRKKYRAKVFLFDRCLICTEVRKRRLAYRQHYFWESLEIQRPIATPTASATCVNKSITLLVKGERGTKREEYSLIAAEAAIVKQWLQATHKIIEIARYEYSQRGKFSLPMDLVLGVGFAIWLIWRYL